MKSLLTQMVGETLLNIRLFIKAKSLLIKERLSSKEQFSKSFKVPWVHKEKSQSLKGPPHLLLLRPSFLLMILQRELRVIFTLQKSLENFSKLCSCTQTEWKQEKKKIFQNERNENWSYMVFQQLTNEMSTELKTNMCFRWKWIIFCCLLKRNAFFYARTEFWKLLKRLLKFWHSSRKGEVNEVKVLKLIKGNHDFLWLLKRHATTLYMRW